jgi:hypothetical protein
VVTTQQGKDDEGEIFAACTATSAGSTELEVRDDGGQTQLSRTVEVKVPDRAAVLAHGPLLLGQDESAAVATSAQVLQGGTATFLVKWYSGSDLLHGNGALEVAPPQGIDGRALQTSFLEDRDWLQVTANASGPVALSAHGHPVATFPVSMVLPTDIARLKLSGMDESQAQKDEWLTVWAQTFDKGGASIYGVDFTWDLEGQTQVGMGDLYRYPYKPGMTKSLGASAPNGMNVSATIHGGQGYVDSTNNIGCSIGGRGRAGGLASLAALLLFGLALRRRG